MKNIILIKQNPHVQLGHLYEHLFMRQVNQCFYDQKLFKFVDYSANGTTYEQGGVIAVDCKLYNDKAIALSDEIQHLKIDYGQNNANISTALHQITAEEDYTLHITDSKKVLKGLNLLDNEPWIAIDDFVALDTTKIRRKNPPIYLTNEEQVKPRELTLSFQLHKSFAKDNRQLVPLFIMLARTLQFTCADQVSMKYGLYHNKMHTHPRSTAVVSTLLAARSLAPSIDSNSILDLVDEAAMYMHDSHAFSRLATDLSATSHAHNSSTAPNFESILQEAGVLIGSKGWQETATRANMTKLLDNISVEIKFGRSKATRKLRIPDV